MPTKRLNIPFSELNFNLNETFPDLQEGSSMGSQSTRTHNEPPPKKFDGLPKGAAIQARALKKELTKLFEIAASSPLW